MTEVLVGLPGDYVLKSGMLLVPPSGEVLVHDDEELAYLLSKGFRPKAPETPAPEAPKTKKEV